MTERPGSRVALSLGDPCGVGPEITVRALAAPGIAGRIVPVVYGDEAVWRRAVRVTGVDPGLPIVRDEAQALARGGVVAVTELAEADAPPGGGTEASARAQLAFFEAAVDALSRGAVDALCTAPVTKAAIARVAPGFSGHTEVLEARLAPGRAVMMLAGPGLRVALVTTHVALSEVPRLVTRARVERTVRIVHADLVRLFGLPRPQIAVCGLNPHAGEGGSFGREEIDEIAPAVDALRAEGLEVQGPLPADGAMAEAVRGAFDVVVAMYHDQGLTAVKALHFDEAVNVTLGLPRPRTSPDHGSALGIAGRGTARPGSMIAAIAMAADLAGRRDA